MEHVQNPFALHLNSGIPVVDALSEWDERIEKKLSDTIEALRRAGHLELIVDLSRVMVTPLAAVSWLGELARISRSLTAHFGRLDVVVRTDMMRTLAAQGSQSSGARVYWASSEDEAVCHIKRIPRAAGGPRPSAHLAA